MTSTLLKDIKELLIFYVKTHYDNYLEKQKIKKIQESEVNKVISNIYHERKEHSKIFVKDSLKKVHGDNYIGDKQVDLLLRDIYEDDLIIIKKLEKQIIQHQNK